MKKNTKKNKKIIQDYKLWLSENNLATKTIKKHLENIDLYLNYYEVVEKEKDIGSVYSFLNRWGY